MIRLTRQVLILGAITLAGCGGNDTTVSPLPHPSRVLIAGGNRQTGTVLRSLSTPLAVQVFNTDGNPAQNVTVEWVVTIGGGTLSVGSVKTNSQGQSSVTWTLGKAPGDQSVSAIVAGLSGSPVNFTATATAPIVLHFDGTPITLGTAIVRWIGLVISFVVILLGVIWVGFDPRKQGWHDKMAGTIVVHTT